MARLLLLYSFRFACFCNSCLNALYGMLGPGSVGRERCKFQALQQHGWSRKWMQSIRMPGFVTSPICSLRGCLCYVSYIKVISFAIQPCTILPHPLCHKIHYKDETKKKICFETFHNTTLVLRNQYCYFRCKFLFCLLVKDGRE